jgi:hypothetical protein
MKSGGGVRRCRVLLGHPKRTALDFRLLAQVEVCLSLARITIKVC